MSELLKYLEGVPKATKDVLRKRIQRFTTRMAGRRLRSSDPSFPVHGRVLIRDLHEKHKVPFRALERPCGLKPMRGMNALRAYRGGAAKKAIAAS